MVSYFEHNKRERGEVICERLQGGESCALVTDAGMPGISDPGEDIVRLCAERNIPVTAVPGPCAAVTALTLSGLGTRRFAFEAFLPSDKKERQNVLEELKSETRTMIIYEAPHRLLKTLGELRDTLGNRRISVCRELTKKHETIFRTDLEAAIRHYETEAARGECVLVIEGRNREEMEKEKQAAWEQMTIAEHVALYEQQGIQHKEAMRLAAKDRGVSKRDIYQALLEG